MNRFVVVGALIVVLGESYAHAASAYKPRPHSAEEIFESVDRKISITPVVPSDGISTGLVIAYGHILKAPYKVEFREDSLYVNEVRVQPSLVSARELMKHRAKRGNREPRARDALSSLSRDARTLYWEKRDVVGEEEAKQITLDYVKAQPSVEDTRWESKTFLAVKFKGEDGFNHAVTFKSKVPFSEPETRQKERAERNKAKHVVDIQTRLKAGESVFFTSEGGILYGSDQREKVNVIMADSSLSYKQKARVLRESAFPGSLIPALDVVANFDPAEWKIER